MGRGWDDKKRGDERRGDEMRGKDGVMRGGKGCGVMRRGARMGRQGEVRREEG